jgi:internalin A
MSREELLVEIAKAARSGQTSLDLSWKQIDELPSEIGQLTKLKSLKLQGNSLIQLPDSIGELYNLTHLEIIGNQLDSLPESIGKLVNLTSLDIRSNKIKNLPHTICSLSSLVTLWLWENQLSELPEDFGNLRQLKSLNLGNNNIQKLPDSIVKLSNLADLDLNSNNLQELPELIGNLSSLVKLDLRSNKLQKIPRSVGNLINLTNLNLRSNSLQELPESISLLRNVSQLILRDNQLSYLPEKIGYMVSLVCLDCNNNKLEEIPQSIGNLSKLQSLILYGNNLHDLPNSITRLVNLKEEKFFFGENPWTGIPIEIVNRGSKSIFRYCLQRLSVGTEDWLYEAKLLIIGEGGAGKTTLANKLKNRNYELSSSEPTTKGIDVLHLDFRHSKGRSFRINIWDFGGQEIYHATHQFFLTKRSLYILVADARQENTNFNYWLEVVELLSESSPVLIVKNEKQDRKCQVNESQLRGRFPNLEKIIASNLKDNRGLSDILDNVKHYISQLPHVGTPLPKTWVYVRHALEDDPRHYITQEEFLELCDAHGFSHHADKLQLSGYLHDLGVCLHFQDDPILKHWIILKPEWGTTAVYTVLDTPKVQQNLGCFTYADLSEIWAGQQHSKMREELLHLMMRFKLCYEIPHSPRSYIAPQLLSPDQPKYNWDGIDNLILRYEYEFMPKGMLTRFTVEMHRLIDNDLVWKEGVILTDNNVRAEIIEAYYKNEIHIRISGTLKKPLLESIRHEFRKIHDSYDRLRYQEFIPCNCSTCKDSSVPYSYALKRLQERLNNNRHQIECDISYKVVNVRDLIDDAIGSPTGRSSYDINTDYKQGYDDVLNLAQRLADRPMNITAEANAMADQSQKVQNFNAPVGVVANDHAQVSNFTQNNNANTAELLQLITSLRQTAATFPKEIQEELTIDLDDVEIELKKPEADRNPTKLKKRLIALATAGTLIATPIAGMTDFANNAIDLATKIGIELPLK